MSDDLKERLRLWSRDPSVRDATHDCHEAADALDARDAALREAESALCIAGDHVLHCEGPDSDDHQQLNDALACVRNALNGGDK